jgi:hypothetical protein
LKYDDYQNFNWKQYINNYPDLEQSGINTKKEAWNHWIHHGKDEGRLTHDFYQEEIQNNNDTFELTNINNIYFKEKYDRYGLHYFGWKEVISQFIAYFKMTSINKYKYDLFFDEWIEKLLVWGNKIINKEYIKQIKDNDYKMITFMHNPPFLLWNDEKMRLQISKEMIVNDNIQFNQNIIDNIYKEGIQENIIYLYTLSNNHKQYLFNTYPEFKNKIVSLHHPIDLKTNEENYFNIDDFWTNKQIYNIGWWLRNFKTFIEFKTPANFTKNILVKNDFLKPFENIICKNNDMKNINIKNEIDVNEYEKIFKQSVIFADIIDCIANNTILECIKFNTPIILRRTKSAEEYLGIHYPLFFNDEDDLLLLHEDSFLLDLIIQSHRYLKRMNKENITLDSFNKKISYDLKKLNSNNELKKLSWVIFCDENTIFHIEKFVECFLKQVNVQQLELLFLIDLNLLIDNELIKCIEQYTELEENIKLVYIQNIDKNNSYVNKITIALPHISTPYITIFFDSNSNSYV